MESQGLLQIVEYESDAAVASEEETLAERLAAGTSYRRYHGLEGPAAGMRLAYSPTESLVERWLKEGELGTAPLGRDVRLYRELEVPEDDRQLGSEEPGYLLCVWWTAAPGELEDLNAWYWEEHIPNLRSVAGWGRIRRFERIAGSGPSLLAAHQLYSLGVFSDPAYIPAVETPWRDRVTSKRMEYARCVLQVAE